MEPKQTFFEQLKDLGSGIMNPVGDRFAKRLMMHGEVLLRTMDKKTFSVHLGDTGTISEGCLSFIDREGQQWEIPWESVANIWTHLGGLE